jgi:hypothetical protein
VRQVRKTHGFFRDEQGDKSLGRVCLTCALVFTGALIAADTFLPVEVPAEAYALLASLLMGLVAWVAGPRIARYVGPQVGAVASGVASAGRRLAGTDDRYRDDERG